MTNKHIHQLRRKRFKSGNDIYFCILDCNYKTAPAFALGKKTICNRCGEPFTMTEYSIRLAKPHCDKCHKSKGLSQSDVTGLTEIVSVTTTPARAEVNESFNLKDRLSALTHKPVMINDPDEEI